MPSSKSRSWATVIATATIIGKIEATGIIIKALVSDRNEMVRVDTFDEGTHFFDPLEQDGAARIALRTRLVS